MGSVNTNSIGLSVIEETSYAVAPTTGIAEYLEPNEINSYGAEITTVTRNPISKERQNRKGTITDFSSTVGFGCDTTVSSMLAFLEGAMYSKWYKRGVWYGGKCNNTELVTINTSSGGFSLASGLDTALLKGTLVYARGFLNPGNNGLHLLTKAAAVGATVLEVDVTNMKDESSPPDSATLHIVGHECDLGDVSIDTNGNLKSKKSVWGGLNLQVGSAIFIGDLLTLNSFTGQENYGLARVREINGDTLVIDKTCQPFTPETGTDKKIRIYYGWFLRNVHTDDPRFKEHSYTFELCYPELENGRTDVKLGGVGDGYEYALGNFINTWELSLPLNDKSTLSIETYGKDVDPIVNTRKPWTFRNPVFTEAFSTPNDFLRLRMQNVDESGLTTFFKDATLTINNNASGENVLGKLGPAFVTYGNFDVSLETSAVFTHKELTTKIRNNCTVTCDFCLLNNDGAFYFDIPAMTLGDGSRDFPVNEKVKINLSSNAFGDPVLGYTISETYFPYLPSDKADACNN